MYIVSNHITIDAMIAIPTMSCAEPVSVNQAIKKPSIVKICAIDSFIASIIHLPINFNNAGIFLIAFLKLRHDLTLSLALPI